MKVRATGVVIVALLVLASCGSRVDPPSEVSLGTGTPAEEGSGSGGGDGGPMMFGTLESPCGPGEPSGGATDTGVSDDAITVATIADPGGPVPGLNKGVHDSMIAFADWCNAQGGINGRELKVDVLDAKLFEYNQRVLDACDSAFALVGGLGVFDDTGAQSQVDCGLPNIPASGVSPAQVGADWTWFVLPNPVDTYQVGTGRWIAEQHPEAVKRSSAVFVNLGPTITQKDRLVEAYTQIGYDFVSEVPTLTGETNWDPKVIAMKDADVGWVTITATYEEVIGLQQAMADQGFDPVMELEANYYNQAYPEQGGDNAQGTYIRLALWPFEEADQNEAVAQYLEALESAVPGAEPELLGVQAWAAGLLFATAVDALGDDVTRDNLAAQMETITSWDSGGLHGVTNPAENIPSTCFILMVVEGDGFARRYPLPDEDAAVYDDGNGFACPPPSEGLVELTGDYGEGATEGGG